MPQESHIHAINQVFALFRRNYHLQYFKAWPNEEELSITKRLWLEALQQFPAEVIMRAAGLLLKSNEFLPTLSAMIRHCELCHGSALPDAHSAYLEACRAPSPKAKAAWSHPLIYHAGKNCGWHFLHTSSEQIAYPHFKREYNNLCQRLLLGEAFVAPQAPALSEQAPEPLDKQTNQRRLQALKNQLKL